MPPGIPKDHWLNLHRPAKPAGAHPAEKPQPPAAVNKLGEAPTYQKELDGLRGRIAAVEAERDHWKANHDIAVLRARVLVERGDIPLDRIRAYTDLMERSTALLTLMKP